MGNGHNRLCLRGSARREKAVAQLEEHSFWAKTIPLVIYDVWIGAHISACADTYARAKWGDIGYSRACTVATSQKVFQKIGPDTTNRQKLRYVQARAKNAVVAGRRCTGRLRCGKRAARYRRDCGFKARYW